MQLLFPPETSRPGRESNPFTTGRPCFRSSRSQSDGLLQGIVSRYRSSIMTIPDGMCNLHSNARTGHLTPLTPTPTLITINPDRTFSFTTRSTPVAHLLKLSAGVAKGSASAPSGSARSARASSSSASAIPVKIAAAVPPPSGKPGKGEAAGAGIVGRVSVKQIYEIAKIKMQDEDMKVLGLEKVARGIAGSARSLGLEVVA